MNNRPCTIAFEAAHGDTLIMMDCPNMNAAMMLAETYNMPFKVLDEDGKVIRQGWIRSNKDNL